MEAEIAAVLQPLSREQIVRNELWAQIETAERPVSELDK
jgi:hypothetical protein